MVKLLDAGIIYPIFDSTWMSHVHVAPNQGGMIVVKSENNESIPTRTITWWRVCIDYRKLNEATWKDHFPLLFIDQMLERLNGHEFYYFLGSYLGYNQIPIALRTNERSPLLVLMTHLHIGECLLDNAMFQLPFKDASRDFYG